MKSSDTIPAKTSILLLLLIITSVLFPVIGIIAIIHNSLHEHKKG